MPFLPPNDVKALKANEDYKTVKTGIRTERYLVQVAAAMRPSDVISWHIAAATCLLQLLYKHTQA